MKRLFISEAAQQPLVNTLMLLMDFGLGMLLVVLAMVMIWRLFDLFKKKGRWTEEVEHELSDGGEVMKRTSSWTLDPACRSLWPPAPRWI